MKYSALEFLTTKELAELLRIKERRVYDLAASGEVPCSRATGKLLFPRKAIDQWLIEHGSGFAALRRKTRPDVLVGSHDPLLEWALVASKSGISSLFETSQGGLSRFKEGGAICAGTHLFSPDDESWNVPLVLQDVEFRRAVLVEWARRRRGFVVRSGNPLGIKKWVDLEGRRVAARQAGSGAGQLFVHLAGKANVQLTEDQFTSDCLSDFEAVLTVDREEADVAFGLKCFADQLKLDFIPIIEERFDLLVCRKAWFDEPFQSFMAFTKSAEFRQKAKSLGGYDIRSQWTVRCNGD